MKRTYLKPRKDDFYNSEAWFRVRYIVLRRDRGQCQLCGRTKKHGVTIQVDHIKPRSKYPHLELDIDNLQTCCRPCNLGKSNLFEDNWREPRPLPRPVDKDKILKLNEAINEKYRRATVEPFEWDL